MVTLKEAKEVAKKLLEEIEPEAIIVFGSVAREGKGEDLDLLIVTDKKEDTVKKILKTFFPPICHRLPDRNDEDPR